MPVPPTVRLTSTASSVPPYWTSRKTREDLQKIHFQVDAINAEAESMVREAEATATRRCATLASSHKHAHSHKNKRARGRARTHKRGHARTYARTHARAARSRSAAVEVISAATTACRTANRRTTLTRAWRLRVALVARSARGPSCLSALCALAQLSLHSYGVYRYRLPSYG